MQQALQSKIESLAIDTLTQFRAGVDKVRIGPIEVKATEAFNWSRRYQRENYTDEENQINGILSLIFNRLLVTLLRDREGITFEQVREETNNFSVEVVNQ